ncbi:MAG: ABC transporter substrate-binding protein [Bryobacteraceae bacterium]
MHADLIHINRRTLKTGEALAKSWMVSPDGREYTLHLRRGLRFSDGHSMDADDVVFTFNLHLDPNTHSAQRDLLVIQGKPISVLRVDSYAVRFRLAAPYAAAERIFDSIAILPSHRLRASYEGGRLTQSWGLNTQPTEIAGLGPFRLKEYVPGQRVVLERNPHYWKADRDGRRLPYLDEIIILFIPSDDAQAIRFQSGELHVISSLTAQNSLALQKRNSSKAFRVYDAGPGLEYAFLFFNLNSSTSQADARKTEKQVWFQHPLFRRAVSAAIDRESIVRIVYSGLGDPLWGNVTRGNDLWLNRNIKRSTRSLTEARNLLKQASFSWKDETLIDAGGRPVDFSILVSAANPQRAQIATIIQEDLRQLGMRVSVVSLESRAMLDRVFNRREFEAGVLAFTSGDADPNSDMNVWLSTGSLHVWNTQGRPDTPWELEIDRLMRLQMITLRYLDRKKLYDRVQDLVAEHLPIICTSSPHILSAATERLANFQPTIVRPYTLWNAESLYFRRITTGRQ